MTSEIPPASTAEHPSEPQAGRRRWLAWWMQPKVAIPLLMLLLVLTSPLLVRGYRLSRVPTAPEPFDTQAVLRFVVPDEQNAYLEYRQAISGLVEPTYNGSEALITHFNAGPKAYGNRWEQLPRSLQEWVRNNSTAIELCKQGANKPSAQDAPARDYQIRGPLGNHTQTNIEALAQLLRLEAARLRFEKRPDEAWRTLLAGLRMSNHIGQHGGINERTEGRLIAYSMCDAIARWAHDPNVSQKLLIVALREFNAEVSRVPPLSRAFQIDYLAKRREADLNRALTGVGVVQVKSDWEKASTWGRSGLLVLGEPELFERCLRHETRNCLSQVDKPRRERTPLSSDDGYFDPDPAFARTMPTPEQIESYFDYSVLEPPRYPRGIELSDHCQVKFRLVATVLALEIYLREHRHCPDRLAELVPHIIPEVPDDLFEKSPSPLKYYRAPGFARVWSVGQDGVNDEGRMDRRQDTTYVLGWLESGNAPVPTDADYGEPE